MPVRRQALLGQVLGQKPLCPRSALGQKSPRSRSALGQKSAWPRSALGQKFVGLGQPSVKRSSVIGQPSVKRISVSVKSRATMPGAGADQQFTGPRSKDDHGSGDHRSPVRSVVTAHHTSFCPWVCAKVFCYCWPTPTAGSTGPYSVQTGSRRTKHEEIMRGRRDHVPSKRGPNEPNMSK